MSIGVDGERGGSPLDGFVEVDVGGKSIEVFSQSGILPSLLAAPKWQSLVYTIQAAGCLSPSIDHHFRAHVPCHIITLELTFLLTLLLRVSILQGETLGKMAVKKAFARHGINDFSPSEPT